MLLLWSPFVLNAFFLLLDFMIVVSFEAALAHISRMYEGYAQSIRWIRQAGMWEMITALFSSKGMQSNVPRLALFMAFLASCIMTAIPIGAKVLVEEAIAKGTPSQELVSSRQFIEGYTTFALGGWTFPVPYDINMEEALASAISSARAIPRAMSMKQYRPKVSEYNSVCHHFNLKTPDITSLVLPNSGCADLTLITTSAYIRHNITGMYTVRRSKDRVKVVIPTQRPPQLTPRVSNTVLDIGVAALVDYAGGRCTNYNTLVSPHLNASHAGVTSAPKTTLTKCLGIAGESIIISTSVIRFMVPNNGMFHTVATSIFGNEDELVKGMQASVANSTLTTLPANNLEELTIIEARARGSEVTALICVWSRISIAEVPHIACAYTVTSALIIEPLPMDPDITRRLAKNGGLKPTMDNVTTIMVFNHYPRVSENAVNFNIPKILVETAAATRYFASLGNNFIVDWEGSMLHVIFETAEIVKGYEFPNWLFYTIIVITVIFALFWIVSKFRVDERYWDSLYITVSRELTGGTESAKPGLHRFNPKTFEFDGRFKLMAATSSPMASTSAMVYDDPHPVGSQDPLVEN